MYIECWDGRNDPEHLFAHRHKASETAQRARLQQPRPASQARNVGPQRVSGGPQRGKADRGRIGAEGPTGPPYDSLEKGRRKESEYQKKLVADVKKTSAICRWLQNFAQLNNIMSNKAIFAAFVTAFCAVAGVYNESHALTLIPLLV